jgi:predicted nucleotidyltransferase
VTLANDPATWLAQRQAQHAALRRALEQLAIQDDRLVAAWWFGSLGRGNADALSDFDLWLVVDDAYLDVIVAKRCRYVEQLGAPVLLLEIWNNAPDPGAYLMANYVIEGGLYQVDWYWQSAAQARLPDDARLIFDRHGLEPSPDLVTTDLVRWPRTEPRPESLQGEARLNLLAQRTIFAWSMLPIIAKKSVRGQADAVAHLVKMLIDNAQLRAGLIGVTLAGLPETEGEVLLTAEPLAQLGAVRQLTDIENTLWPALAAAGVVLPVDAPTPVMAHLDRVEQLLAAGIQLSREYS